MNVLEITGVEHKTVKRLAALKRKKISRPIQRIFGRRGKLRPLGTGFTILGEYGC